MTHITDTMTEIELIAWMKEQNVPDFVIEVCQGFRDTFREVYPKTLKEWVGGFNNDIEEIPVWIKIEYVYKAILTQLPGDLNYRKTLFGAILERSMQNDSTKLSEKLVDAGIENAKEIAEVIRRLWEGV